MHYLLILVSVISFQLVCFTQEELTQNEKLTSLCKVWGFVKYHHPAVNEGNVDFDEELLKKIELISLVTSRNELHQFYSDWVNELNMLCKKKEFSRSSQLLPLQEELFQKWESQEGILGITFINEVKKMMLLERKRKNINYAYQSSLDNVGAYISKNEKLFVNFIPPDEKIQLLSLFRYWNVIEYFYPHKPTNWDEILEKHIPEFKSVHSTLTYHLALSSLTAEIKDGHTSLKTNTKDLYNNSYLYQLPFNSITYSNYTVITGISKEFKSNLNIGDTIITIDHISVSEKLDSIRKYFQTSNESSFYNRIHFKLFSGTERLLNLTVVRNGDTLKISENRYTYDEISVLLQKGFLSLHNPPEEVNQNIIYIDPSYYNQKTFSKKLKQSKAYQVIILDMRGYPLIRHNTFTNFISGEKRHFAILTKPNIITPGLFISTNEYTGRENKNPYQGKIILLVNTMTQSASEYSCMAMQSFDNVITIGTTSAGADGNISKLYFPGNVETTFTGLGVYYPDATPAQKLGVKIDIKVNETAISIINKEDVILKEAIQYAMSLIKN